METNKTTVIYENYNPNQEGVTFLAIRTGEPIPYVFGAYSTRHREDLPKPERDLLILPIEQAMKLFSFKEGKLADIVK